MSFPASHIGSMLEGSLVATAGADRGLPGVEGAVGADAWRGIWLAADQSEERGAAVTGDWCRGPLCSCVTATLRMNSVCTVVMQTWTLGEHTSDLNCAMFREH